MEQEASPRRSGRNAAKRAAAAAVSQDGDGAASASRSRKKGKDAEEKALQVGAAAPDFSVPDQSGKTVKLSDLRGKNVVVYFYPKDDTPGCTKEGCRFRDLKDDFDKLDTVILGVSADSEESHQGFIGKHSFNFSLLADTERGLIKAYGAAKGNSIQRATAVVDKEGKVAAVWTSVRNAATHPDEVLAFLKSGQEQQEEKQQ